MQPILHLNFQVQMSLKKSIMKCGLVKRMTQQMSLFLSRVELSAHSRVRKREYAAKNSAICRLFTRCHA